MVIMELEGLLNAALKDFEVLEMKRQLDIAKAEDANKDTIQHLRECLHQRDMEKQELELRNQFIV